MTSSKKCPAPLLPDTSPEMTSYFAGDDVIRYTMNHGTVTLWDKLIIENLVSNFQVKIGKANETK